MINLVDESTLIELHPSVAWMKHKLSMIFDEEYAFYGRCYFDD